MAESGRSRNLDDLRGQTGGGGFRMGGMGGGGMGIGGLVVMLVLGLVFGGDFIGGGGGGPVATSPGDVATGDSAKHDFLGLAVARLNREEAR